MKINDQRILVVLFPILVTALGCGQPTTCSETGSVKFGGTAFIRDKITATPSPDNQQLSLLFDQQYQTKDTFSLKKDFFIEFGLDGKLPQAKVRHMIRYFTRVDTTESFSLIISHLGVDNKIVAEQTSGLGRNDTLSFTETIPCDSTGLQKYRVQLRMKNKDKKHISVLQIDSWDAVIE